MNIGRSECNVHIPGLNTQQHVEHKSRKEVFAPLLSIEIETHATLLGHVCVSSIRLDVEIVRQEVSI